MTWLQMLMLFLSMAGLAALPSASVALVITRSISQGPRQGIWVALGILCGDLLFAWLAIVGMSSLSHWLGDVFQVVRWLAGGYLLWLGWQLLRSGPGQWQGKSQRGGSSFVSGLLLTLADVKAIFFYASLFPVFVDLDRLTLMDIASLVWITIGAVGGVKVAYALLAARLAERLSQKFAIPLLTKLSGATMLGFGGYLLSKH
ncbi:LysE family translocator [Bowmanella denitrificans]|uniref:LysE family translocator n=1 Tax=Bowmanella denitrificans TaxID=366582 RepID=A0ABP3GE05_9ALTE